MATLAMLIWEGMSNSEVYKFLKTSFLPVEYGEIFLYFFDKFPKIDNHIEIIFMFCELCLMCKEPNWGAGIIFNLVVKSLNTLKPINSSSFFGELLLSSSYRAMLDYEINNLKSVLDKKLSLYCKYIEDNHFIKCSVDLLRVLKKGLDERIKGYSIWSSEFGDDWRKKSIHLFGCPLIRLNEEESFIYTTGERHISDSVDYLFATVDIFNHLIDQEISKCPFYDKFCVSELKDSNICLSDPIKIPKRSDGAGCIFSNVLEIIGVRSSVN